MSTSPDISNRAADELVSVLSHWLGGHLHDAKLLADVERIGSGWLTPEQAEAVDELLVELRDPNGHAGELNMVVRETLAALSFGT